MNDYQFKTGDKVKYIGCSQDHFNWGGNDDPRDLLLIDHIYEIAAVENHSWHTKIHLKNIAGRFNSVCFEKIKS